jgi:hypothetical protein
MVFKALITLATLVAVATAACPSANDPKVIAWSNAITKAEASVRVSTTAFATTRVSASVFARAVASAATSAGSLANIAVTKQRCIAAEASSGADALAKAGSKAVADAYASATAYAAAEADAWAAAAALAEVNAITCNCPSPPGRVAGAANSMAQLYAASEANARSAVEVNAGIATAAAAAGSLATSYSQISAKVCNVCKPGFQQVTIDQNAGNTQETGSGSISCSAQAKRMGFC